MRDSMIRLKLIFAPFAEGILGNGALYNDKEKPGGQIPEEDESSDPESERNGGGIPEGDDGEDPDPEKPGGDLPD